MFSLSLRISSLVAVTAFGLIACSDDATSDTDTGSVGGVTSSTGVGGSSTVATATTGTDGGTTMGSTTTSGTTVGSTTGGMMGAGGTSTTSTTGVGGTTTGTTTGMGGASSGMGGTSTTDGMGGTSTSSGGASSTGMAAGGTANAGMDLDMTAEDFTCIADWDQVLGFRINNLLGNLEEALAVAQSPTGGVYPVGTVIQHLPTEAMVKRATGFSPESKDWEFFLLSVAQDGTTTITDRGTTEITTMGNTCVSCHSLAPDQWDFVCNTWGNEGGDNCGFDFDEGMLAQQIAADPRCQ